MFDLIYRDKHKGAKVHNSLVLAERIYNKWDFYIYI